MSNKRKPQTKSLAHYRSSVKTGEPFTLPIDEETSIVIERPTGDQILDAEACLRAGDSRGFLEEIAGDVADELLDVLGAEDFDVLRAVARDIQKHFGLGE